MAVSLPNHPSRLRGVATSPIERLSATEQAQLGQPVGGRSKFRYVPLEHWGAVRDYMLAASRKAAVKNGTAEELPARMTAYTPGETLALLDEPEVRAWHRTVRRHELPLTDARGRPIERLVFVPCAKTKPWDTATRGLYGAYNAVRARVASGELPATTFVTISEPLGIVPEADWGRFPQYDNPGLFRDEYMRCGGIMTADWPRVTPAKEKFIVPFDPAAYTTAVDRLADVIADFLATNAPRFPHAQWISVVGDLHGELSTHTDMLTRALARCGAQAPAIAAHPKKAAARRAPEEHIATLLQTGTATPGPRALAATPTASPPAVAPPRMPRRGPKR